MRRSLFFGDALFLCPSFLPLFSTMAHTLPVHLSAIEQSVTLTEIAFAKTMFDRDLAAFESFLSNEIIIWPEGRALKGKKSVVEYWSRHFQTKAPPFSWEPRDVHVIDSGVLAFSSGPVLDSFCRVIGHFNSIWRFEEDGGWRLLFDRGSNACGCDKRWG